MSDVAQARFMDKDGGQPSQRIAILQCPAWVQNLVDALHQSKEAYCGCQEYRDRSFSTLHHPNDAGKEGEYARDRRDKDWDGQQ